MHNVLIYLPYKCPSCIWRCIRVAKNCILLLRQCRLFDSFELTGYYAQVQRPGIEPIIYRDLFLFRTLASFLNGISLQKLGCNAELIVDEFGEKLLEELDYTLVCLFDIPNCSCLLTQQFASIWLNWIHKRWTHSYLLFKKVKTELWLSSIDNKGPKYSEFYELNQCFPWLPSHIRRLVTS